MSIEKEIKSINVKEPNEVIKFYEENLIYFSNYHQIEDVEKISDFIDVKLHYANSLTDKHHLDKLLNILEEVSFLIGKLPENHWNYIESERHFRFLKGMALGRKCKFNLAYQIFKELTAEDPNHYYYKVWYNYTRFHRFNWIFNSVAIIGGILIFGDIIFSLSDYVSFRVINLGLVITATAYISNKAIDYYIKSVLK